MMSYTETRGKAVVFLSKKISLTQEEIGEILHQGFVSLRILNLIRENFPFEDFAALAKLYQKMGPSQGESSLHFSHPLPPPPAIKHRNPRAKKPTAKPLYHKRGDKKVQNNTNTFLKNIINRHTDGGGAVNLARVRILIREVWQNCDVFHDPETHSIAIVDGNGRIIEEALCPQGYKVV